MTAKWTEVTETTVPARVEREETEFELWTHKRSAHRCHQHPATPAEIGRGLQALEPAERAEALTAAGVEPTPPATPEEIGEVLAGLEPDERDRAFNAAGVPSATPEELAAVVAALPPDERLRVLRALGAKPAPERTPEALGAELAALDVCEFLRAARAAGIVEARRLPRTSSPPLSVGGVPIMWFEIRVGEGGLPLSPLAEARAELGELHRERDQAQAERDKAVALQDAAVNRLAVLERERDQAQAALREAQRENIAIARAAVRWRERAAAEAAAAVYLCRERDQARAELAALREALNQPALGAYRLEQTGSQAAVVTEDDGASVEVRVGCMSNLVRVPGDRWICLGAILRAARALP